MRMTTVNPKPQPTKVLIEMTDKEACELRDDFEGFFDNVPWEHTTTKKFVEKLLELTKEW